MNEPMNDTLRSENKLLRDQIKKVQERYEDKIAELSIIRELGMSLLHVHDFQRICQYILEIIINNTVAQNCSIMLLDQEKDQLFLLCSTNLQRDTYILETRKVFSKEGIDYKFKLGEGVAGKALLEKKPVLINNTTESDIFTQIPETKVKVNSILSVPLIVEDKSVGVINISHTDINIFEPNDIYLFRVIGDFVTILLYSALNYEKLQYSEANYRALFENSNNGIAIIQDDVHYYANPKYQELSGYSIQDLEEKTFETLFEITDSRKNLSDILSNLKNVSHNEVFNARMRKKNGPSIDVEVSASSVIYNGKKTLILSVLDISDRIILEKHLIHAQKMQSLGTLAGGIAHNFNNLLMGIQGNASMVLMEIDQRHPYYRNLENIEKLVKNGSNLTNQLLGYAQEGKYEVKPVDLNHVVKETSDTFGAARKDIKISLDLIRRIYGLQADQGQIEQMLINLYVNAADAMPDGGELFIKTLNVTDKDMQNKPYRPKKGNYVMLTVRDTGSGMDSETMERIFEPFFTTKGLAKGTGLGLASTYGIVKGHGGYIDVDSREGLGTTFNIYLPSTAKMLVREGESSDRLQIGTGTILLVDDEEIILYAGEQMLNKLGYKVLVAKSGREALEIYKENQDTIDLVLLDMVMPAMGGGETYEKMKEICSDIKVLLSSGYSLDGQATEIMNKGCDGFIQKPFSLKELSQKVKEMLEL